MKWNVNRFFIYSWLICKKNTVMSPKSWEKMTLFHELWWRYCSFSKMGLFLQTNFFCAKCFFRQSKLITLYVVLNNTATTVETCMHDVWWLRNGARRCLSQNLFFIKSHSLFEIQCVCLFFSNWIKWDLFCLDDDDDLLWYYVCGLVLKQENVIPIMMSQLIWFFARG